MKWILSFLGILLLLSCMVLGKGLAAECSLQNGASSMQKVLVSVKNRLDTRQTSSFSPEDIRRLREKLSEISCIAQSGLISTPVSWGSNGTSARLTGADYMYPQFNGISLISGSFITQRQEDEGELVAVIDDEVAEDIFKSTNVAGKALYIYGRIFRIIGVVRKDDSIIGRLTDDGLPDVYIPVEVMLEMDTTAGISALQVKTGSTGLLDENIDNVSEALGQIGKDPSKYNISDYNQKYALMEQAPLILVFMLGIVSMLILLAYLINSVKRLYLLIREGCRADYLSNAIRSNLKGIGGHLLRAAAALSGMVLVWLGIGFRVYIPPQYIPDELINTRYYSNLIKSLIQGGIRNMGYIPSRPELAANTVNVLINLLFWVSLVLGLLVLYWGFRELRALDLGLNALLFIMGLFFVFSLALLALAAYAAGLPFVLELKGILVLWAFIFLNTILITKRKESGIQNV